MTLIIVVLKVALFFYANLMIAGTKFILVNLFILLSFSAYCLEADNYIVWDKELDDSSIEINQFFNEKIHEAILDSRGTSCSQITKKISKTFASYFVNDDPIANWLMQQLDTNKMYPLTTDYVSESIYRDPFLFYIPKFGLSPSIQVRGRYFGMDKLSHFGATGMHYFNKFNHALSRGKSVTQAYQLAIDHGIREENTLYGYWASGVFSFADLEANFQGMLFYKNLCSSPTRPYLAKRNDESWYLKKPFDIKKYVSGFWDESYNLSYRLPGNWKKVSNVLRRDYCPLIQTIQVTERFNQYSDDFPSFSVTHLKALQRSRDSKVPNPLIKQSLEALCL